MLPGHLQLVLVILCASASHALRAWDKAEETDDVLCGKGKRLYTVDIEPNRTYTFKTDKYWGKGSLCGVRYQVSKCASGVTVVTKKLSMKSKTTCYKRFLQDKKKDLKKNSLISVCGTLEYDSTKDKAGKDKKIGMTVIDETDSDFEGYTKDFQLVYKTSKKEIKDKDSSIEQEIFCKQGKEVIDSDCKCGDAEPLKSESAETRVISASATAVYAWAARIKLMNEDGRILQGTLISDEIILTADHEGITDENSVEVTLYAAEIKKEAQPTVVEVSPTAKNGLRMIKISKLDFDATDARPVCLPSGSHADDYLITDQAQYVLTYGSGIIDASEPSSEAGLPQALLLKAVKSKPGTKKKNTKALDRCKKAYTSFKDYMGCAMIKPTKDQRKDGIKRIGLCKGDEGAPLLVPQNGSKMKPGQTEKPLAIVGVFTDYAALSEDDDEDAQVKNGICGNPNAPARFTRLDSELLDWIHSLNPSLATCEAEEYVPSRP